MSGVFANGSPSFCVSNTSFLVVSILGTCVAFFSEGVNKQKEMAAYRYMRPEELVELLDDPVQRPKLAIIDCRDDERNAGFIIGSLHAPTALYTDELYRSLAKSLFEEKIEIAVFHCQLSQVRGPRGALRFAAAQRDLGYALPNVFVLKGGWEAFYDLYGNCRPDLMYY